MIKKLLPLFLIFAFFCFLNISPVRAEECTPITPSNECSINQSVNVSANVLESSVTFSGFAPAGSVVTIKEGETVIGTTLTNANGQFSKTITSDQGVHTFTLYATDDKGLSTPEVFVSNVNVSSHTDTPVGNINLPPTISLSKAEIIYGANITISGQASPGSTVNLFLNGKKIASINLGSASSWKYELSSSYSLGKNEIYATSSRSGLEDSQSSKILTLQVNKCAADTVECKPTTSPENPEQPNTPSEEPSGATNKNIYNIDFKFGLDFGGNLTFLTLSFMFFFSFLIVVLLFFLFLWWSRKRKHREEVLERLEKEVELDMKLDHPDLRVERDFLEAEKEIEE